MSKPAWALNLCTPRRRPSRAEVSVHELLPRCGSAARSGRVAIQRRAPRRGVLEAGFPLATLRRFLRE